MLEEYAQIMRLLLDPEQRRASFEGKHFRVANAPNNPKPLQPRIPIWIGGRGEKRTLRAAAKYADGWNGAYIGPEDWAHKGRVLDQWCETEGRDPKTIMRTVNLGFYLGVDAKGAARAEETFQRHFGGNDRADRTGYLRGTVKDAHAMVDQFRALGCTRLSIAFREGPYDWEALEAFAARSCGRVDRRVPVDSAHRRRPRMLDRVGASPYRCAKEKTGWSWDSKARPHSSRARVKASAWRSRESWPRRACASPSAPAPRRS
jgi:alkanesulfonate monooxygenase SsuD/methylene tetrahydromethanopterin reductase-like flavin-dependent oxidoreductase (luciferase family)